MHLYDVTRTEIYDQKKEHKHEGPILNLTVSGAYADEAAQIHTNQLPICQNLVMKSVQNILLPNL